MKTKATVVKAGLVNGWQNTYRGPIFTKVQGWMVKQDNAVLRIVAGKKTAENIAKIVNSGVDISKIETSELISAFSYLRDGKLDIWLKSRI